MKTMTMGIPMAMVAVPPAAGNDNQNTTPIINAIQNTMFYTNRTIDPLSDQGRGSMLHVDGGI